MLIIKTYISSHVCSDTFVEDLMRTLKVADKQTT